MRTPMLLALAGTVLVGSACGADQSQEAEPRQVTSASDSPTSPSPTEAPSPSAAPGSTACDQVVAGIAAFNLGDFDATIDYFELAVPLAEEEAEAKPSDAADDLVDAVHYYADLPAEDYLDASASSPEFAKYKAITLGQCIGGPTAPAPPSSSGVSI